MEERKGDARIYIVSGLFFACILSGGAFLCLYLILPSTESSSWYPIAGLILVGIPWAFWLLAYLYRCFGPSQAQVQDGNFYKGASSHAASPQAAATTTLVDQERGRSSPVHSPNGGRHVQFGVVTVMGSENNNGGGGGAHIDRDAMARQAGIFEEDKGEESQRTTASNEVSVASRESEIPLTFSSSS